eukprot:Opistho-2@34910
MAGSSASPAGRARRAPARPTQSVPEPPKLVCAAAMAHAIQAPVTQPRRRPFQERAFASRDIRTRTIPTLSATALRPSAPETRSWGSAMDMARALAASVCATPDTTPPQTASASPTRHAPCILVSSAAVPTVASALGRPTLAPSAYVSRKKGGLCSAEQAATARRLRARLTPTPASRAATTATVFAVSASAACQTRPAHTASADSAHATTQPLPMALSSRAWSAAGAARATAVSASAISASTRTLPRAHASTATLPMSMPTLSLRTSAPTTPALYMQARAMDAWRSLDATSARISRGATTQTTDRPSATETTLHPHPHAPCSADSQRQRSRECLEAYSVVLLRLAQLASLRTRW